MILELISVLAQILVIIGILSGLIILVAWIIKTAPDDVEEE